MRGSLIDGLADPIGPQRLRAVVQPLPLPVRRSAVKALAGMARDVDDLRLLADMLGLIPAEARGAA